MKHTLRRRNFQLSVDVQIPTAGITGLFGESGSGKTTLLRCIAGLEADLSHDSRPVHKRGVGYVFQEPQLFPHLDVRRNIEFGLRRSSAPMVDQKQVVEMLGLGDLLDRKPDGLSGGEAQRVAIAAVLLRSPQLVLMDEPLASLDQRRKDELLPYLDRLHDELSVPMIYVSHSIDEVSRLCDHLLLIEDGRIVANGELHEMLSRLDLPMLSGANAGSVIEAKPWRYDRDYDLTQLNFSGGELSVPGRYHANARDVRLRIAAQDVSICLSRPDDTTILNVIAAEIDDVQTSGGASALVRLVAGTDYLLALVTRRSVAHLDLKKGDQVFAQVKSVTVKR
ncbi:MAG: molybdenum ABC transporter ATP-binding protein [Gammaproteobacteria bacterium]|nr:molybdenum ABC transporter ATP-binding protein [Gammaproteobacteria bacterium]MBT8110399.1 molybdenum ABC transporter ATP-binding protein [Gammaproteobacteria bacterium]NND46421.1 molybdenum ABC transporter ATP-binding protein [Woeseiaceae bacterium]NNL45099.1 molybdenum ABC transporter ATP-binding protein [Woeseiaceae bacterium]